jgi:hypothetical protein
LTDILDLFLAGDLKTIVIRDAGVPNLPLAKTHHNLDLVRFMRKLHGDLEEAYAEPSSET